MACCEFEPKIRIDCAMQIVSIVRAGELASKKWEAAEHAGCFVGCLAAKFKGDQPEVFAAMPECDLDLEGCCDEIEAQAEGDAAQMNPMMIAIILRLIELVLKRVAS